MTIINMLLKERSIRRAVDADQTISGLLCRLEASEATALLAWQLAKIGRAWPSLPKAAFCGNLLANLDAVARP